MGMAVGIWQLEPSPGALRRPILQAEEMKIGQVTSHLAIVDELAARGD
jgi:hypothetical protein